MLRSALLATVSLLPIAAHAACDPVHAVVPKVVNGVIDVTPTAGQTIDLRGLALRSIWLRNSPNGVCVLGGAFEGKIPLGLNWGVPEDAGHQIDAVNVTHSTGVFTVDGARINDVSDAIAPPKAPDTDRRAGFVVRNVYATWNRDDFLEDDAALGGLIEDTLVDGTHVFVSARPSRGNVGNTDFAPATLTIRNTLARLQCMPDDRTGDWTGRGCGPKASLSVFWKWSVDADALKVDVSDTILMMDDASRNVPRVQGFPPGTYRNVTLIYLGPGDYPGKLPAGVTVTKDRTVWDRARQAWLDRHATPVTPPSPPDVPADLPACAFHLEGLVVVPAATPCRLG